MKFLSFASLAPIKSPPGLSLTGPVRTLTGPVSEEYGNGRVAIRE